MNYGFFVITSLRALFVCRGCACGVGSGIRTHATRWVTGFQGLRVIHSAIPTCRFVHWGLESITFTQNLLCFFYLQIIKIRYKTKKGKDL